MNGESHRKVTADESRAPSSSEDPASLHELQSPQNAARLFAAIERARSGSTAPQSVASLREEFGLEE